MRNFASLLLLLSLLFVACDDDGATPVVIDDPVVSDGTPKSCDGHDNSVQYQANRDFAFDLFQSVNLQDASKNVFTSPLSVSIALTMLYNGTNDPGKSEMDEVMHLNGIDLESLNQNYFCMLEELLGLDEAVLLKIANSVWSRNDFQAKEEFLNYADSYLDSEFFSVDFADPAVLDQINNWISDQTDGKITDALDQIPGNVVMYLINAIYFNADWKYSFDPDLTYEGLFFISEDDNVQVDFMRQKNEYRFMENDDFKAIDIPYGNDAFSLSIVLPDSEINSFVQEFSEAAFVDAISQMETQEILLTMPKFEMEYKILLNDVLIAMGMNGIFDGGSLENIQEGAGLFVSRVIHQTFLEIDEVGTEAAGVTIIEIAENASIDPEPTMMVNRPFLFYIRERSSNTVLFSGKMLNPTE